jgi:peptidoglycan/xylan/chitin deacetylase (PgdA/CDA1 family)
MLRERLHKLLSPVGHHSGAYPRRWRALAQGRGLTAVLCCHRVVASPDRRKAGLTVDEGVTAATFEAQIRFMLRYFDPVSPSEAVLSAPTVRPRFAVTLDDGYVDNHDVAAPLLLRLGVPAAFYVVSEYVGTSRRFWWDRLAALLRDTPRRSLSLRDLMPQAPAFPAELPLRDAASRRAATDVLGAALRQLDPSQVEPTVDRLQAALDVDDRPLPGDRLMDWGQVRHLAAQGFEIGAHSADHLNLAFLGAPALEPQIAGAKARIEAETGSRVETFAYPYGGPANYSPETMAAVRRAGFHGAFTAISGVITGRQDVTELPRLALNWPYGFACAHNLESAIRASA